MSQIDGPSYVSKLDNPGGRKVRTGRICHLNATPKVVDMELVHLEKKLSLLGNFVIHPLASIQDHDFLPCDLLLISAQNIPQSHFTSWLRGVIGQMQQQASIWVPGLIMGNASFEILREILALAGPINWYFDIMDGQHLESLPIRVANLLRIHDHLHELRRYEQTLSELSAQMLVLESRLQQVAPQG